MRDWQVEQDAWEVEERSERPATIGDVERIALEIATDDDDAAHREIDLLRADFGAMAERLVRAEAALADAHRRQDGLGGRLPAAEREIGRLATRVAVLEEYLREAEAWIGARRQEDRARAEREIGGRS